MFTIDLAWHANYIQLSRTSVIQPDIDAESICKSTSETLCLCLPEFMRYYHLLRPCVIAKVIDLEFVWIMQNERALIFMARCRINCASVYRPAMRMRTSSVPTATTMMTTTKTMATSKATKSCVPPWTVHNSRICSLLCKCKFIVVVDGAGFGSTRASACAIVQAKALRRTGWLLWNGIYLNTRRISRHVLYDDQLDCRACTRNKYPAFRETSFCIYVRMHSDVACRSFK